ncbi:MAG: AraC family transcriptional regulator [Gemmatimonadota bacterium]
MTPILSTGRFYGETVRRSRSERFTVTEVRFPGGFHIPAHSHERPIVNFVLAGTYTEIWGCQRRECQPAETLFHPAGLIHSERFAAAGARCLAIEFDAQRLGLDEEMAMPAGHAVFPRGRWTWISTRLLRELRAWDPLSVLVVEGLLLVLLSGVARRELTGPGPPPPFVRRARELLSDRFTEPLRIGDVAAEVGVHPSSLARAFQQHYRCTPGEFVRRLRVDLAGRRLAQPAASLASIARETGFSDQSHFSRTFKSVTGMTPGVFRDLVSGN